MHAPAMAGYSPSLFSRTITQSSRPAHVAQREVMPGRMRVGRTLAY
jgi:hypothetical protein